MDEDWRNAFGILMCTGLCDGTGAGICDGTPSTCSSSTVCVRCLLQFFFVPVSVVSYVALFCHYLFFISSLPREGCTS